MIKDGTYGREQVAFFGASKIALTNSDIDLRHLIAKLGAKFADFLEKQHLFFAIRIAPDMPRFFKGNAAQIKDLINNMAFYSLNHIDDGGVVLDVKSIPESNQHHRINFCLTTTGMGIPPQMQKMMFQPSRQESSGSSTLPNNLCIAKCIAIILGGDISVYSPMGCGARYEAEINLEIVPELSH